MSSATACGILLKFASPVLVMVLKCGWYETSSSTSPSSLPVNYHIYNLIITITLSLRQCLKAVFRTPPYPTAPPRQASLHKIYCKCLELLYNIRRMYLAFIISPRFSKRKSVTWENLFRAWGRSAKREGKQPTHGAEMLSSTKNKRFAFGLRFQYSPERMEA